MDPYAYSQDRAYAAPNHGPVQANQFTTDHTAMSMNSPAYGLHYNYVTHPAYAHHPYQESMYIQPQTFADYSFPSSAAALAPPASEPIYHPAVPLHAPVPVSPFSTLISPVSPISQAASDSAPAPPLPAESNDANVRTVSPTSTPPMVPSAPAVSPSTTAAPVTAEQSPLEYYGNATQVMFPTPSELLTELSARDVAGTGGEPSRKASVSGPSAPQVNVPAASVKVSKIKESVDAAPVPAKAQPETQRKAYFRRVAEAVGFNPTDPDSITSHDKKRSYLECLEQYVQWLHEQTRLVGREPVALERVQQYRGPSSRSIRTLLVHMQDEVRELHQQMVEDERAYMDLQTQIQMQHAAAAAHHLRRHSVAACGFSDASLSSAPFLQPYPITAPSHHAPGTYQQY
ncbi:uncharacterized protein C8Q71DRAFT_585337 [Rhodofomes roseus]|uniref:GLTSCR protein conserved domain-containing protein n=1 Tax=Rhodofomes roseus TaxID=34475 RepID=A0ABQ8KGW2_9APHY|nr:uncharacterized protein C8Q71DRAFT_585337 [Rhodofomes roseus]KAH9837099.1 hypothetical protein C8Q71DRAFT_585337 [Rhodofomes roseus]